MNSTRSAMSASSVVSFRLDSRPSGGRVQRVLLCPLDDLLGAVDHRAVVEDQGGDPAVAGEALDLLAARPVDRVGQRAEAVGLLDLGIVAGLLQRAIRVAAGVAAGARRVERPPAHVELHRRSLLVVRVVVTLPAWSVACTASATGRRPALARARRPAAG